MINPEVRELPTTPEVIARIGDQNGELRLALLWLRDFRLLPLSEQVTQAAQLAQKPYPQLFNLDKYSTRRHLAAREKLEEAMDLLRPAFQAYHLTRQPSDPDIGLNEFTARMDADQVRRIHGHLHSFVTNECQAIAGALVDYEEHRPIYAKWLMLYSGATTKTPRGLLNPVYEEDRLPEDCPDYKLLGGIVHMTRMYGQFQNTYARLPFDKLVSYCAQLHFLVNQLDFKTINALHVRLLNCNHNSLDYQEAFVSNSAIRRFSMEDFALQSTYGKEPAAAPEPLPEQPSLLDHERMATHAARVRAQMAHLQNLVQRAFRTYIQAHQYLETA